VIGVLTVDQVFLRLPACRLICWDLHKCMCLFMGLCVCMDYESSWSVSCWGGGANH